MTKRSPRYKRENRRSGKQNLRGNGSEVSVSRSRSNIALTHQRIPSRLKANVESEEGFPDGCAITKADFRTIMGSRHSTPLPSIGSESHIAKRICTPSDKVEKNDHFLPDINSHIHTPFLRRHDEHEEQRFDIEMFDVECIRKTRSGIAFTQYLRRPYHLPRLLSEGQIERRAQPRVSQYASFVPITTTKPNRSGGNFTDNLRREVEERRKRREDRNLENMRTQLQEREMRVPRAGRSHDNNEDRVRAVVDEQESIRRANFQKHVRQFMSKRH